MQRLRKFHHFHSDIIVVNLCEFNTFMNIGCKVEKKFDLMKVHFKIIADMMKKAEQRGGLQTHD